MRPDTHHIGRSRRRSVAAAAALALALCSAGLELGNASAASGVTKTFAFDGAEQIFTVPDGVTSVTVTAIGGAGANGGGTGNATGGSGAVASGTIAVTPGQNLFVEVGGNGDGSLGGFNGGGKGGFSTYVPPPGGDREPDGYDAGGGGGATDIRTISKIGAGNSLNSRLVIAGGGGGGGGDALLSTAVGGKGGAAGDPGLNGSGHNGGNGTGNIDNGAGAGATRSAPGSGDGITGAAGQGGSGLSSDESGGGGGGGGGGKFGGAGAAAAHDDHSSGAGGGGGSTDFAATVTKTSFNTDATGVPLVKISYSTGGENASKSGLKFGKPKLNKAKGTAILPVTVPGSGTLSIGGAGVVHKRSGSARLARLLAKAVPQAGTYKLKIKAKGAKKEKLHDTGKVKVKAVVTFKPTSGDAVHADDRVKLKQS